VRIKFTPEIHFHLDETMERMDRINRIINRIHSSEKGE
jgi:ribosome-binding factor A